MANSSRKIGFFGGSFDPVHLGHLILGYDAIEQFSLDLLYFIPAGFAPLRDSPPMAEGRERLRLLELATAGEAKMGVLALEIERPGRSYTIDTLRTLRQKWSGDQLYWILGSDQFNRLSSWKDIETLATLCEFLVLTRSNQPVEPGPDLPENLVWHSLNERIIEISSTEIRQRLADRQSVRHFLPPVVADYIEAHPDCIYPNPYPKKNNIIAYG